MDTLHTVLNRGCSIWDRAHLPESEFRARLQKVRAAMKQRDLDLLLVYGDSRRYGHLAFVSHFIPKNRGALAAIPLEGEPALVVQEPSRNNPFSKTLTWIEEVRSVGQFAQGLGDALKARNLKPKRVGLASVEEQLNIREYNGLVKLLEGTEFHNNMSDPLESLRLIKSPSEQRLLRETSRILEDSLRLIEKEMRAGEKEYELAALAEREARRQGVEDFRLMLARSSEPEVGLRPAGDSSIGKGEALLVLVAASYQRYWAEIGRTFCLGNPPAQILRAHTLAKDCFNRLKGSIQAGSPPSAAWLAEVPSPARKSITDYGLGNGVGLDLTERPLLGGEGTGKIEPGMALTLRVSLSGSDCGSALISQPFLVQKSALEPLAKGADDLVSVKG